MPVSTATAAVEKIILLGDEITDPESGARKLLILNPSADVDVTFTSTGFKLEYVDVRGGKNSFAIHADYPKVPASRGHQQADLENRMMGQLIESEGSIAPGALLKNLAQQSIQQGQPLALRLDTKGKVGFVVTSFDLNDVKVMMKGQPVLSLAQIVFNLFSHQVNSQIATLRRSEQASREVVTRTCGSLFETTAR